MIAGAEFIFFYPQNINKKRRLAGLEKSFNQAIKEVIHKNRSLYNYYYLINN